MTIVLNGTTGIQNVLGSAAAPAESNTTSSNTGLYFPTSTTLGLSTAGTNAVYIDASQQVGIGTTSPAANLHISSASPLALVQSTQAAGGTAAAYFAIKANSGSSGNYYRSLFGYDASNNIDWAIGNFGTAKDVLAFYAGGLTERMRIDSSGNLLVGTTSLNGGITGITNNLNTMTTRNTGATAGKFWKAPYVDTSNQLYIINNSNTGVYITDGGVAWVANSDERLKTTLTPFENAVEKICSIRSGTGRYLADDESVSRSFLIAQDVQKILPEAVSTQNDEQKTLGLAYTDLIPLLVAAIKEQQALITTLTARIEALEAK
jgi:hypothetical protein